MVEIIRDGLERNLPTWLRGASLAEIACILGMVADELRARGVPAEKLTRDAVATVNRYRDHLRAQANGRTP